MDPTFEKLSNIHGHSGSISIDKEGNLLLSNGECQDTHPNHENSYTKTIYNLIQDVNQLITKSENPETFEKITIGYSDSEIGFTVFNSKIYGVKKSLTK